MPHRRSLLPGRGNPMRPILILLAGFFGAMLIAFPVLMQVAGVGTAGTVGVTLFIVVVAILCLGIVWAMARTSEEDRADMLAGDTLARWRLAPDEHRRFLAEEQRRTRRKAAAYALSGTALGAVLGLATDDWLLGGIMVGVFLLATTVILTLAGPPRSASAVAGRDVLIGKRGVQVLDRYLPFQAPLTSLRGVELRPGDPALLLLRVRSGRQLEEVRVPVPRDRIPEAETLAERFSDQ